MCPTEIPRFIVDHNVAKLARWLRMMGYDTIIFDQSDDWEMVRVALAENRVILTRDTGVIKRRIITTGKLKALLVASDHPAQQIQQVVETFQLNDRNSFSLCIVCNMPLVIIDHEQVKDRVPPYIYKTQSEFVECPICHHVYWKGTHWQAMTETLERLRNKHDTVESESP